MFNRYLLPVAIILSAVMFVAPNIYASCELHGKEKAQNMVAAAIDYFDEVGAETAFAKFTNDPEPEFRNQDTYIFVTTMDDTKVAHGVNPLQVGHSHMGVKDADGTDIGAAIISATSAQGGWVHYKYMNPETGKAQSKATWVVLHEGYIFGAGIYKP